MKKRGVKRKSCLYTNVYPLIYRETMDDEEEKRGKTWQLTKKSYKIPLRVTAPIYDAMLGIIESGAHFNVQDYLMNLIRRDLRARGIKLEEN